jgi:hypothetical protein
MTASNIKRLSLAAVRLQANQKAPEKRACSGREAMFFLNDFLCEWEALATIRFAAQMGINGFDIRDAFAGNLPDVLFPYDIANANDHANLL